MYTTSKNRAPENLNLPVLSPHLSPQNLSNPCSTVRSKGSDLQPVHFSFYSTSFIFNWEGNQILDLVYTFEVIFWILKWIPKPGMLDSPQVQLPKCCPWAHPSCGHLSLSWGKKLPFPLHLLWGHWVRAVAATVISVTQGRQCLERTPAFRKWLQV